MALSLSLFAVMMLLLFWDLRVSNAHLDRILIGFHHSFIRSSVSGIVFDVMLHRWVCLLIINLSCNIHFYTYRLFVCFYGVMKGTSG